MERIVLTGSSPSLLGAHGAAEPRESGRGADMKRFTQFLVVPALAIAALIAVTPGCSKQGVQRVAAPATGLDPSTEFESSRWITAEDELKAATARAAKSPVMAQAVVDQASDPRLSLLKSGVMAAAGITKNGDQVQVTLFPYQYLDQANRAVYFVMIEVNGAARVQSFELMRNEKPGAAEIGFERVNDGDRGLWLREGPTYLQAQSGVVRRAPEKFNWARFATCFIPLADRLVGGVEDGCHSMGDFPGCVAIGTGAALLGAGLYCGFAAWNG